MKIISLLYLYLVLQSGDNYNYVKKEGIKQVRGYLEIDKIKTIPKLRSYLVIGSKDGVEFILVDS